MGLSDEDEDYAVDLFCPTITAINTAKDLVPIDLAKGILGTIANILTIAQVRWSSMLANRSSSLCSL